MLYTVRIPFSSRGRLSAYWSIFAISISSSTRDGRHRRLIDAFGNGSCAVLESGRPYSECGCCAGEQANAYTRYAKLSARQRPGFFGRDGGQVVLGALTIR